MHARKLIVGGISSVAAVVGVSSIVYAGVNAVENRREVLTSVPTTNVAANSNLATATSVLSNGGATQPTIAVPGSSLALLVDSTATVAATVPASTVPSTPAGSVVDPSTTVENTPGSVEADESPDVTDGSDDSVEATDVSDDPAGHDADDDHGDSTTAGSSVPGSDDSAEHDAGDDHGSGNGGSSGDDSAQGDGNHGGDDSGSGDN